MEEMIKLTNGKKTIIRSKIQYEANVAHFKMRGFTPYFDVRAVSHPHKVSNYYWIDESDSISQPLVSFNSPTP